MPAACPRIMAVEATEGLSSEFHDFPFILIQMPVKTGHFIL